MNLNEHNWIFQMTNALGEAYHVCDKCQVVKRTRTENHILSDRLGKHYDVYSTVQGLIPHDDEVEPDCNFELAKRVMQS